MKEETFRCPMRSQFDVGVVCVRSQFGVGIVFWDFVS